MAVAREALTLTAREVADLLASYMKRGLEPEEAGARVIDDVRAMGLQDALLDVLGPRAIVDVWVHVNATPAPTPIHQDPPSRAPRRVDVERLKESASLLEGMYQIGDAWHRIGDMDKSLCRSAAQQFKAKALENAQTSRYFHELAKTLNGGERVRERFDDAALMRLWDVAGQGG